MGSNYIQVLVKVFKYKKLNLPRDTLRFSPVITVQTVSHTYISFICYRRYIMFTIDSFIKLKKSLFIIG